MSCGGGSKSAAPATATVAPAATTAPVSSAGADKPTPAPTQAAVPTPLSSGPVTGAESVSVQTPDGLVIKGNLFSAPGPKRRLLVIASALPDTEGAWQDFAKELAGSGIATLTFQTPQYKDQGSTRDLAMMPNDIGLIVSFVESRDYPLIYVLGDTTAGDGALSLAAKHKLAGVITVSTPAAVGASGSSLDPKPDLPKITAPKLFISSNDTASSTAANILNAAAPDPKTEKLFAGGPASGVGLLRGPDGAAMKQAIKDFLNK